MKGCAVIATHHKTGTVWMRTVFQRIAKLLQVEFSFVEQLTWSGPEDFEEPSIVFARHSEFRTCRWLLNHPGCRIFHLIRDPRDVVISAMHYHRSATEGWLHKSRPLFDNMTYQEKINSLPDDQARYLFEMQQIARRTIRAMGRWRYNRKNSFEGKYETLIEDFEAESFSRILCHLGFEKKEIEVGCDTFKSMSLFAKENKKKHPHIRSGQRGQWESVFNAELADAFVRCFGDVLITLGYEQNGSWVDSFGTGQRCESVMNLPCAGGEAPLRRP